jgi:ABC-type branched-subunit amino acid transport system ATPase component
LKDDTGTAAGAASLGPVQEPASRIAALGVCQVPEGRRLFGRRSIADNPLVGGWVQRKNRHQLTADSQRL